MMKYLLPLTFLFATFISSCRPEGAVESDNIETQQLREEVEQLKAQAARKDSSINSFLQGFNQIQENLAIIKEKEGVLTVSASNPEMQENREEQIINDLQTINQLMAENRDALARMNSRLRKSNIQAVELKKMMDGLQQEVEVRNARIAELQARLEQMNEAYKNLYTEYNARIEEIDEQTRKLNTAWYAIGTSKELQEQGVITREGGFIGLGKADKLRSDFNTDYFTGIDVTQTLEFPLMAKKANVVTTHPGNTYELVTGEDGKVSRLVIKDPAGFWKASKYLVVVISN